MIASVVDTHLLARMLYTSLIAGVAVSTVFALAVYGLTRASDLRRDGRSVLASGYAVLGGAGVVATAAIIVYGLILLARKS